MLLEELMVALETLFPNEQIDPVDSKSIFVWSSDRSKMDMICNIVKQQIVIHFRSTIGARLAAEIGALLSMELRFTVGPSFFRLPDQSLIQGDAADRYARAILNPDSMTPVFLPNDLFIESDETGVITNRGVRYSN